MAERVEIDAREVLDKYIALIRKTGGRSPQDLSELPAPKPVIKAVLLHVLKIAPREADVTPIKQAFFGACHFSGSTRSRQYFARWMARTDDSAV
jgi:hypothetical protein